MSAWCCPKAACIELSVPLQLPQALKPDFFDRPIQKNAIYTPVVSVDAEMMHFRVKAAPLTIFRRRFDADIADVIAGPASPPHAVQKHRYPGYTSNINPPEVPFGRTSLNVRNI